MFLLATALMTENKPKELLERNTSRYKGGHYKEGISIFHGLGFVKQEYTFVRVVGKDFDWLWWDICTAHRCLGTWETWGVFSIAMHLAWISSWQHAGQFLGPLVWHKVKLKPHFWSPNTKMFRFLGHNTLTNINSLGDNCQCFISTWGNSMLIWRAVFHFPLFYFQEKDSILL